jgi:hypothetical protein
MSRTIRTVLYGIRRQILHDFPRKSWVSDFTSTRPGGFGGQDIWVAHRTSKNADWESPANLPQRSILSRLERVGYLSPDGHLLLFQSDRGAGLAKATSGSLVAGAWTMTSAGTAGESWLNDKYYCG